MKKIRLPIEEEKKDKIKPGKPDFLWFGKMLGIVLSIIIGVYLFFYLFSYIIVGNLTIEREKEIFGNLFLGEKNNKFDLSKLKTKVDYFKDYDIYIKNSSEINAYAMIGANIYVTKGFLENIETEEELIFVLGHEIEHIKNRDVIKGLSKTIPFIMTLQAIGLDYGNNLISVSSLTENYFSRKVEEKADLGGINLINNLGLNLDCAIKFFERSDKNHRFKQAEILSSHPDDKKRIEYIKKQNQNKGKKCTKFRYE